MATARNFDLSDNNLVQSLLAGTTTAEQKAVSEESQQQPVRTCPSEVVQPQISSLTLGGQPILRVPREVHAVKPLWMNPNPTMTEMKTPLTNFVITPFPTAPTSTRASRKRKDDSRRKRRRTAGNGLRQFSEDVLRKVERKGTTTYNEVADELVSDMYRLTDRQFMLSEEKNIRRRVYDALNVLLAMKIITKDKKLIKWSGMPASQAEQVARLEKQKLELQKRVHVKRQELNEMVVQQVAFANLIERNRDREALDTVANSKTVKLHLPFIVVNTRNQTSVDCWMSSNRDTYVFNFNDRFEMHDDVEVLKRSGLAVGLESGKCHGADLEHALRLVDINLRPYILEMALKSHLAVLNKSLAAPSEGSTTAPMLNAITLNGEDEKDNKDFDSVVISQTLHDGTSNSVAENAKCEPSDLNAAVTADVIVNCDDDSLSEDHDSEDEDSASSNNDDSDVEPSI